MRTPRVQRPRPTYANVASTLALVLALSTGGAYAAGKIGSAGIQDNAVKSRHLAAGAVKTPDLGGGSVKTAKIKGSAVTLGKLAPGARPAKVVRFKFGAHDFSTETFLALKLPGVTRSQLLNSEWDVHAIVELEGQTLILPLGVSQAGDEEEPVALFAWDDTVGAHVQMSSGGAFYMQTVLGVRVTQTIAGTTRSLSQFEPRIAPRGLTTP